MLEIYKKHTNPGYWNVKTHVQTISSYYLLRIGFSHYNLRQISQFSRSLIRSVCHGTDNISYFGPKNMGYTT